MLRKIKQHIPLFIAILLGVTVIQSNGYCQTISNEKVFVHLNRNILLSGSELKYKAYITNENDTNLSTIIYFELMDCNQLSMLNWKSNTFNACVSGIKTIPESIPNGIYYLIAYTNKIRNYPTGAINAAPLLIQRIYEDPLDTICINKEVYLADSNSTKLADPKTNYLTIEINEDADYTIVFKPLGKLKTANLSVSVTEISPITPLTNAALFTDFNQKSNSILKQNTFELQPAEKKHSILSGKIINNTDSTPLAQKLVYLAYYDTTLHFAYFNTTKNGEFCFLLDSSYNNKQLYLQLNDFNCHNENVSWVIDNKTFTNLQVTKPTNGKTTLIEKEYVSQLQKREIVDRVYNPNSIQQNTELQGAFKNNFFQSPTYIIKPADYIELPNFQEICDNILPSIRFKVVDTAIQIGMVIDQQVIYDNVLICVNGIPCFNMKYIENLSSKDIKKIEIFNSVLMHGDLTFNGVIAIYTHKNNIDERAFCNPYYTYNNKFYNNSNVELLNKKEPTPLVNPNVYWNPTIIIKENTQTTITFKKPEIGKQYIISINGLINNTLPFAFKHEFKLN